MNASSQNTTLPGDSSNAPFTSEQVEWLATRDAALDRNREAWVIAREERLAEHGTNWSRRHIKSYTRRALVGFLILLLGVGGAFYTSEHDRAQRRGELQRQQHAIVQSGRVVAVDGCNRDFTTITRLRGVLANGEKFSKGAFKRGDISATTYRRTIRYYNTQLHGLPLPDCRDAKNIITDDPTKPKGVPDPKYPTPPKK